MQRNYHKKTVNQRLKEQVTTLAAKLYAAEDRIKTLSAANTKLVQERDRATANTMRALDAGEQAARSCRRQTEVSDDLAAKLRSTRRRLAASVALNIVLIVALAVVIVRCV